MWVGWSGFPSEGGSITGVFATEGDALAWLRAEREKDIAQEIVTGVFVRESGFEFTFSEASEIERGPGDRPVWLYDFGTDVRMVSAWPVQRTRSAP